MNNYQNGINNINYEHGYKGTRLYNIWALVKQRCLNPNSKDYPNYGGRGIGVCNEWLEFIPFRDWAVNNGYTNNLTIDRVDANLGYNPNNCQWIPGKENSKKQRTNKLTQEIANDIRELYNTDNYTQKEIALKYNLCTQTVLRIVNNKYWINN